MKVTMTDPESAFVLGSGARTMRKIGQVAGLEISLESSIGRNDGQNVFRVHRPEELDGDPVLSEDQIRMLQRNAMKYLELVRQQSYGDITLDAKKDDHGDLSTLQVPGWAVGFICGARGKSLRGVEADFGVLILFVDGTTGSTPKDAAEQAKEAAGKSAKDLKRLNRAKIRSKEAGILSIFGRTRRQRLGALLRILSQIEIKDYDYLGGPEFVEGQLGENGRAALSEVKDVNGQKLKRATRLLEAIRCRVGITDSQTFKPVGTKSGAAKVFDADADSKIVEEDPGDLSRMAVDPELARSVCRNSYSL